MLLLLQALPQQHQRPKRHHAQQCAHPSLVSQLIVRLRCCCHCSCRRFPINISSLNDIMRSRDRGWHCGRVTGATFSTLCKFFAREGLLEIKTQGYSVMVL
jgi:hypothetical protein